MHPPARRGFRSTGIPLGLKALLGVQTAGAWHPPARIIPFVYGILLKQMWNLWCSLVTLASSVGRNGILRGVKSRPPAMMEPFDFGIRKREKNCNRFEGMPQRFIRSPGVRTANAWLPAVPMEPSKSGTLRPQRKSFLSGAMPRESGQWPGVGMAGGWPPAALTGPSKSGTRPADTKHPNWIQRLPRNQELPESAMIPQSIFSRSQTPACRSPRIGLVMSFIGVKQRKKCPKMYAQLWLDRFVRGAVAPPKSAGSGGRGCFVLEPRAIQSTEERSCLRGKSGDERLLD